MIIYASPVREKIFMDLKNTLGATTSENDSHGMYRNITYGWVSVSRVFARSGRRRDARFFSHQISCDLIKYWRYPPTAPEVRIFHLGIQSQLIEYFKTTVSSRCRAKKKLVEMSPAAPRPSKHARP